MFCQKCGAKLEDDACFCTACGEKISVVNETEPQPAQQVSEQVQWQIPTSGQAQNFSSPVWQGQPVVQHKKKKPVIPIVIGVAIFAVLVIVAVIVCIAMSGSRQIDYIKTAQAYMPFAKSQDFPYTMEEVLDEYFEELEWEESGEDDEHCVDVRGKMKETGEKLRLSIGIKEDQKDSEVCHFSFESFKLGDEKLSDEDDIVNALGDLFWCYDEGYDIEDLLAEMDMENGDPESTSAIEQASQTTEQSLKFSDMPKEFYLSSGAGAWGTSLTLSDDGSFVGSYYDYEADTMYLCDFSGYFGQPEQISEYEWSASIESLVPSVEPGTVGYDPEYGTEQHYDEPYGLCDTDKVMIYCPGMRLDDLPEGVLIWLYYVVDMETDTTLPCYVIYNPAEETAFVES